MNLQSEIYKITFNQVENNYKLIFKEVDRDNFCDFVIRSHDAKNIALSKENIISSRLKSYDLIINILNALSITIDKILINKKNNRLFSTIILLHNDRKITLDANFIDSVIIALKSFSIVLINKELYHSRKKNIYDNIGKIKINEDTLVSEGVLLQRLRKTLIKLIDNEQYEHAALIRDRIKELSETLKIN